MKKRRLIKEGEGDGRREEKKTEEMVSTSA